LAALIVGEDVIPAVRGWLNGNKTGLLLKSKSRPSGGINEEFLGIPQIGGGQKCRNAHGGRAERPAYWMRGSSDHLALPSSGEALASRIK
jgi:hypothetical protein